MSRPENQPRRLLPVLIALALTAGACGDGDPSDRLRVDSETHWLELCEQDADCGGGLSCVCGLCTTTCADATTCPGMTITALCDAVPGCVESEQAAVCLAACEVDADCAALGDGALRCSGGLCLPDDDDAPLSCEGPNPAGCMQTGCSEGEVCDTRDQEGDACRPSGCSCDATLGTWICTSDCSGGVCVPEESACAEPNPAGCAQTGCGEGEVCDTSAQSGPDCRPSACSCDPQTGTWGCSTDCGGGVCAPSEVCSECWCNNSNNQLECNDPSCPDVGSFCSDDEPEDPDCHHDCFGHASCEDGVVTWLEHMPVPCAFWTGSCPVRETITCEQGCRSDVTSVDLPQSTEEAAVLCAENAP